MPQSDQESQNQYLVGTCVYKDQLHIISISENKSIEQIYSNLARKWAEISPDLHALTYLAHATMLSKRMPVILRDDEDVLNMFRYHRAVKLAIVNIAVELKNDGERFGWQDNHISRSGKADGLANEKGEVGFANVADKESHGTLKWYCNVVAQTNPGSTIDYETFPDTQKFRRIFICFNACVVGFFSGCRPLIFLDDTPMRKRCLLSATTKDSNDDFFILAYAVVDAKTDDNWEWFCLKLRSILDSHVIGFREFTFFSAREYGLVKAVPVAFPGSYHARCVTHLLDMFKKEVMSKYPTRNKEHWASVLERAAYAPSNQERNRLLSSMYVSMPFSRDFYQMSELQWWANSYFNGSRWGVISSNQAEYLNKWVKSAQSMPVVLMVDYIREQIMVMMKNRQEESNKLKGVLCPKQENKLKANFIASRTLKVSNSSTWAFLVEDVDGSCYDVDFTAWTCTCRAWNVFRIPCKHACACIESESLSGYDFTDPYYRVEIYRRIYKSIINPIPTFVAHPDENADEDSSTSDSDLRSFSDSDSDLGSQTDCKRRKVASSQVNVQMSRRKCC